MMQLPLCGTGLRKGADSSISNKLCRIFTNFLLVSRLCGVVEQRVNIFNKRLIICKNKQIANIILIKVYFHSNVWTAQKIIMGCDDHRLLCSFYLYLSDSYSTCCLSSRTFSRNPFSTSAFLIHLCSNFLSLPADIAPASTFELIVYSFEAIYLPMSSVWQGAQMKQHLRIYLDLWSLGKATFMFHNYCEIFQFFYSSFSK